MNWTKRTGLSVLLFGTLTVCPSTTRGTFIEHFPTDNDGWLTTTINNGGKLTTVDSTYSSIIAGDLGLIQGAVGSGGHRLFDFHPGDPAIFGSLTGLMLQTDYMIEGTINSPSTPMVRFYVGNSSGGSHDYFVSSDAYSWDPNTAAGWTTHSVPLTAGNFIEWPSSGTHLRTFDQVIAAPEEIGILFTGAASLLDNNQYMGFKSNVGATISLTNFGTTAIISSIPEPVSLLICTLGAVLLLLKRHRASV